MNQGQFEPAVPSIDQVVDLLEAYADARLQPRGAVLARMRRHVIAELDARTALLEAERATRLAAAQPKWWQTIHLRVPRGIAVAGMTAAFTFGTAAAVLAAPAGSPLYGARVALEQVFLPPSPADRIAAHERLLKERLAEAQAAADAGNMGALQASLTAYQAEVDAAVAEVGYDPALLEFLHTSLVQQTALLETMAISNPAQAAAIQGAIHANENATQHLDEVGGDKDHDGKPDGPPPWAGVPGAHATPPPANGGDNNGGENGNGQGGSGGGDNDRP
ncbi:MAG TPA: DUF5667 domain-containing protein [Candidatus Limnocylindrales bacterium]|nr:DUF5667 domain-containing protein [Candidatus Limnocylindrales bacterium]